MSEINSQINQCDFQIYEDLLTEIRIVKEILKVSKESRREFGRTYYDTIEELDINLTIIPESSWLPTIQNVEV